MAHAFHARRNLITWTKTQILTTVKEAIQSTWSRWCGHTFIMNAFYVTVSIPLLLVLAGFNHAHGLTTFGKSNMNSNNNNPGELLEYFWNSCMFDTESEKSWRCHRRALLLREFDHTLCFLLASFTQNVIQRYCRYFNDLFNPM